MTIGKWIKNLSNFDDYVLHKVKVTMPYSLEQLKQKSIPVYSVSELNAHARQVIETHLSDLWIVGELSNVARPYSGHLYFSLKDDSGQIRCAFFRYAQNPVTSEQLVDGQQVLVQAKASIYQTRGEFQLLVQSVQTIGDGALQLAFEKLKNKLSAEGLFDTQYKKSLPALPSAVGIVTSATGAALQDILKTLKKRCPLIPVYLYPTQVQGKTAHQQIVSAIELANKHQHCDVLIVGRGGGSLEDLWCFNHESVARAIFTSQIPIVTGIGHEIDYTIADFVADSRAVTPTAAALTSVPDQMQWLEKLHQQLHLLNRYLSEKMMRLDEQLNHLQKRLRHPRDDWQQQSQLLDQLEQRFNQAIKNVILNKKNYLTQAIAAMQSSNPIKYIDEQQRKLGYLSQTLDALSPLKTLGRGYAIITNQQEEIICDKNQVTTGEILYLKLSKGILVACVQ